MGKKKKEKGLIKEKNKVRREIRWLTVNNCDNREYYQRGGGGEPTYEEGRREKNRERLCASGSKERSL